MFTEGHKQNHYRPTGQNVGVDAARILEEILEQRMDEGLKHRHKVRRIKTHPYVEKVSNDMNESENVVKRSKTIPANYKEASKEEIKQSEIEAILDKIQPELKPQDVAPDGSESSADTEDNLSLVSQKRKKKSFLKRAKERLMFTFRRDQKGGSGKVKEKNTLQTSNSKTQRNGKIQIQSKDVKELIPQGKSVDPTQVNNHPNKNGHMYTAVPSVKKEKGKFWTSFRKSKKSSQVTGNEDLQRGSDGRQPEGIPSPTVNGSNTTQIETQSHPISQTSAGENILKSHKSGAQEQRHQSPDQQSADKSPPSTNGAHSSLLKFVPSPNLSTDATIIFGTTSVSSNDILLPENTSQSSVYNVASFQSNVLDCPGDDIQFIDAIDLENREEHGIKDREYETKRFRKATIQFSGTRHKFNMNFLASQSPDSVQVPGFDKRTASTQRILDSTETTTINANKVVLYKGIKHGGYDEFCGPYDELDGAHDEPDGAHNEQDGAQLRQDAPNNEPQNVPPDREANYSLIAQKLIDIADSYSTSGSDEKTKPSPPKSQISLSSLEIEILECLRSVGDGATKQVKEDMYKHFHSTVQNSLGNDLSWKTVAFFFSASREVISTLGKGSRAAKQVKDFTLQYVNDTFASWIIDHGGFDSLVSSEESDFDVD